LKQAASPDAAPAPRVRRVKLQHILFLLLLLPSVIPLVASSFYLLKSNREALQVKEKELLTLSAQGFAQHLSDDMAERAAQLRQVGQGLVAVPGFTSLEQRLRQDWAKSYLQRFIGRGGRDLRAFRFVDQNGRGQGSDMNSLAPDVIAAMNEAFSEVVGSEKTVYRFALIEEGKKKMPAVAMAVSVAIPDSDDQLILQALAPLAMHRASGDGLDLEDLFLIDAGGALLWSAGAGPQIEAALLRSDLVKRFASLPINVTSEIELDVDGVKRSTLAQVVPVRETGWGVVAHKTTEVAFQQVRLMVIRILMFSALAALLALGLALFASRRFSLPIQRLAETTHEIAAGHFDRRVSTDGLSFEVAELAEDFNRMSDTVESYIERLQKAAEVNRRLFISSIRAFAAAIDAKDPYTRGHSERVASYSRAIARYLGLPKDVQEKVWISAVLHDVGKIGVEDRVLKKHGVLTPEEFDQMKLHPVIGADIVEPISALREHLPGIRWHHEAWNGAGYPDGLKGEQIPLMARIIGVADTFDAITTNRPYQTASSPEFALQTIKKLTGTRFDARIVTGFLLAWDAGQIRMDVGQPATELPAPAAASAEADPRAAARRLARREPRVPRVDVAAPAAGAPATAAPAPRPAPPFPQTATKLR
jgi:HD-GYP domain-containing protein (c-di-GMP phosphodiesterase class II)